MTSDKQQEFNERQTATLDQAVDTWHRGREVEALRLFDQAIAEDPGNVRALLFAARSYGARFHIDKAEALLSRVLKLEPSNSKIFLNVGKVYEDILMPDRAIEYYEAAQRLPSSTPINWILLAAQYERINRGDEARALIDRSLAAEPRHPQAMLIRARLERRGNQPEAARATLDSIIAREEAASEWACEAWAGLAELNDLQGDYDAAMSSIAHCKQAQLEASRGEWRKAQQNKARYQQMFDDIRPDDMRRWQERLSGETDRRIALLTGFPRSGTTLVEQLLDSHADLISAEEYGVFGRNIMVEMRRGQPSGTPLLAQANNLDRPEVSRLRENYWHAMERMLEQAVGDRLLLDKNPASLKQIPLTACLFPEMRYLVALRDPRDVILSCYLRYLPVNSVSVSFLSLERAAASYAFDMSTWLTSRDLLGEDRWCELRYEDSVADLEAQARRALQTLGLEWDAKVMNYRDGLAQKRVSSPSYEAVSRPIYTSAVGRWKNYQKYLEPVLETLAPCIRAFGYS